MSNYSPHISMGVPINFLWKGGGCMVIQTDVDNLDLLHVCADRSSIGSSMGGGGPPPPSHPYFPFGDAPAYIWRENITPIFYWPISPFLRDIIPKWIFKNVIFKFNTLGLCLLTMFV